MRRTGLNAPRSRAGCEECRRRRKKCSQDKPKCTLCQRNGKECSYELKLQWGGRSFSKSIFGQYGEQLTTVQDAEGSFVYTPAAASGTQKASNANRSLHAVDVQQSPYAGTVESARREHEDEQHDRTSLNLVRYDTDALERNNRLSAPIELSPYPNLEYLGWLRTPYKSLLNHFITVTAPSISCHSSVSHDYCSILIPLALENPGLMAAILQMSGHNRRALALDQSEADLDRLKGMSVTSLRNLLSSQACNSNDVALATMLALGAGDVIAGGERPGSWRTHLKGAAAMIEANDGHISPGLQRDRMTPLQLFLRRWFLSLEATTLLGSHQRGVPKSYSTALKLSYELGPSFIDELCGFPPILVRIFGEFTTLAQESRQARHGIAVANLLGQEALHVATSTLGLCIRRGYDLLAELDHAQLIGAIHPTIESTLSVQQRNDFHALTAAFHHSTAVHIHRRIIGTPSASLLVQSRLKAISELVFSVTFARDACPGVAFLLPLFTAGCEAIEPADQQSIELSLVRMQTLYGMGNARSALDLLKEIWKRRAEGGDEDVEWEKLSGKCFYSRDVLYDIKLISSRRARDGPSVLLVRWRTGRDTSTAR
jgi:hypothetical protein